MAKHSTHSVVITRPLAQAAPLAQRIEAMGREAIVFPLLEIHPLSNPAPFHAELQDLNRYAMVAFVSPNAIDATFEFLQRWPEGVAVAVVGEGSRMALAKHGVTSATATIFSPRDPMRTDSQTLLEVLDLDALRGKRVLIVRGETGRELLTDALRTAGAQVTQIAAYRRTAPEFDESRRTQLNRLLDSANDWIITSSEALRILRQMVEQLADTAAITKMQQQRIILSHVRIAETAQALGFQNITLTGSGDEQLLAALQSRA